MCLLLQGNHSDHLELSYYAISSHLDNQNSRKPVVRAFFTHIDAVITRNNKVSRPKYFLQPFRPLSPVRYHACLSSYAKLSQNLRLNLKKINLETKIIWRHVHVPNLDPIIFLGAITTSFC